VKKPDTDDKKSTEGFTFDPNQLYLPLDEADALWNRISSNFQSDEEDHEESFGDHDDTQIYDGDEEGPDDR